MQQSIGNRSNSKPIHLHCMRKSTTTGCESLFQKARRAVETDEQHYQPVWMECNVPHLSRSAWSFTRIHTACAPSNHYPCWQRLLHFCSQKLIRFSHAMEVFFFRGDAQFADHLADGFVWVVRPEHATALVFVVPEADLVAEPFAECLAILQFARPGEIGR